LKQLYVVPFILGGLIAFNNQYLFMCFFIDGDRAVKDMDIFLVHYSGNAEIVSSGERIVESKLDNPAKT